MYEVIISENKTMKSEIIKFTGEDGTELWIPIDEANVDYQAYLAWLEENK